MYIIKTIQNLATWNKVQLGVGIGILVGILARMIRSESKREHQI